MQLTSNINKSLNSIILLLVLVFLSNPFVYGATVLETRVIASSDDAEEVSWGPLSLTSSDLELVTDSGVQTVGLRFLDQAIPVGAIISNAYIQFQVDEISTGATSLILTGEADSNPVTFSSSNNDISNRIKTNASIVWEPADWNNVGQAGLDQRTPDISSLVQEIISSPAWALGNSLVLFVDGSGQRTAESYDGLPSGAALLHIEYSMNDTVNTPPVVEITSPVEGAIFNEGDTVSLAGVASDTEDGDISSAISWTSSIDGDLGSFNTSDLITLSVGIHTVTASITDSGSTSILDTTQITIYPLSGVSGVIDTRVSASSDDGEEVSAGYISINSSDLELVADSSNQTVGLRFLDQAIPAGAIISNAYIQFQVDEVSTGAASLLLTGEASDNAETFSNTNNDISNRTKTNASVDWQPADWNVVGQAEIDQRTPDISSLVQEIVSNSGWASGNSLVFFIDGSGRRTAESYDGSPSGAAVLHIEYTTNGIANTPPQLTMTSPISGTEYNEGDSVLLSGSAVDVEDGDISAGISWSSNLDGELGIGSTLTLMNLNDGTHTISATIADSNGASRVINVVVVINGAVIDNPPVVVITSPAEGVSFTEGDTVSFVGTANDTEDGDISSAIIWSSNIDGNLGTGASLSTAELNAGSHTISATITDTNEAIMVSSILIVVTSEIIDNGPTVEITSPADNATFDEGDTVSLVGVASDIEDGQISSSIAWSSSIDGDLGTFSTIDLSDLSVGIHIITATITDSGGTSILDTTQITIHSHSGVSGVIDTRISASSDDAEEVSTGYISVNSSDLELVEDSSNQTVGLRFLNQTIPVGSVISSAYIQFQVDEISTGESALILKGQTSDLAETFTSSNNNIANRTKTNASVLWEPADWNDVGQAGIDQRTPDISALVQEIISNSGWVSGNPLVFFVDGSGRRTAESYDGSVTGAALLHIEYTTNGTANTPPQLNIISPTTGTEYNEGDSVLLSGSAVDIEDGDISTGISWSSNVDGDLGSSNSLTIPISKLGSHIITAAITDSNGITITKSITVIVTGEGSEVSSLDTRITSGTDDSEELSDGSIYLGSSDLDMTTDGGDGVQTIGLRFSGQTIPNGATIINAYIQFQADEANVNSASLVLTGEANDNALTFTGDRYDITGRAKTNTTVNWSPNVWDNDGEAGLDQQTPNIQTIIQEIIDRPNWQSGNAIAFTVTGTGQRNAESYEGDASGAPLLHVEYTTANLAPVAINQTLDAFTNQSTSFSLSATDANMDTLSYSTLSLPDSGSLSGVSPNLIYTPDPDFVGVDSFTFQASDNQIDSNIATITFNVAIENLKPEISSVPIVTGTEGELYSYQIVATDPEEEALTYGLINPPSGLEINATGLITWVPSFSSANTYTIQYNVIDASGAVAEDTYALQIQRVNILPVALAQDVLVTENSGHYINLTGTDSDLDPLTYSVTIQPSHGQLLGAAPNLRYIPDSNYTGADSFTFIVNDGYGDSISATVLIDISSSHADTVGPVITIVGDNPLTVIESNNSSSPLGTGATAFDEVDGNVSVGTIDYSTTPQPDFSQVGAYQVTYTAQDKAGNVSEEIQIIHVIAKDITDPWIYIDKATNPLLVKKGSVLPDLDTGVQGYSSDDANSTFLEASRTGTVNVDAIGHYPIIYTVTHNDKTVTATRTVIVYQPNQTVTPIESHIPQTGEQNTFQFFDDGYYQVGTERNYTRDEANSTVIDNVTGLIWEDTVHVSTERMPHSEALTYCSNLTLGGLNWTLPHKLELLYLMDFNRAGKSWLDPRLDTTVFNSFGSDYWAVHNRIYATSSTGAYTRTPYISNSRNVRCVSRPGASPYRVPNLVHASQSSDVVHDVVHDTNFEFMWQDSSDVETNRMQWSNALHYCENLELEGFTDWRLPNVNEGHTIVEHLAEEYNAVFRYKHNDVDGYPNWWTASSYKNADDAWSLLSHYNGIVGGLQGQSSDDKDEYHYVRCVRNFKQMVVYIPEGDQTIELGDTVSLTSAGSFNPEGQIESFRWVDLNNTNEVLSTSSSLTKSDFSGGIHEIELTITDNFGIEVSTSVFLKVGNILPIAEAGPDQVGVVGHALALDAINSTDSDGRIVSYIWKEGETILTTDASFLISTLLVGEHTLTLTVTDEDGAIGIDEVVISIVNNEPVIHSMPQFRGEEGAFYSYQVIATNPIDEALTYRRVNGPEGLTINQDNGLISWTPDYNAAGSHDVEINVTNSSSGSVNHQYTLYINNINQRPIALPQNLTAIEDQPLVISLQGTDVFDNSPLSYILMSEPSLGSLTGVGQNLTYSPRENITGPDSFTYLVNDGLEDSTVATVSINITPDNDAPVVISQTLKVTENESLNFSLYGADIEGDAIDYTVLIQPTSGQLTGSAPNLIYTPNAQFVGDDSLTFKVNDGELDSSEAVITFKVSEPVVLSLDVQSINEGEHILADKVMVSGEFTGPKNSSIIVNGLQATLNESQFVLHNLPVSLGDNAIQVELHAPDHDPIMQVINITSDAERSFLSARFDPSLGLVPLNGELEIHYNGLDVISELRVDFESDGVFEYIGVDSEGIKHTYQTDGVYELLVEVDDVLGHTFTTTSSVVVQTQETLEFHFQEIFESYKQSLLKGDKAAALKSIMPGRHEKYEPILDALLPHMTQILSSYSPLQFASFNDRYAEFAVNRTQGNTNYLYFIYFMKDEDGMWRIYSM